MAPVFNSLVFAVLATLLSACSGRYNAKMEADLSDNISAVSGSAMDDWPVAQVPSADSQEEDPRPSPTILALFDLPESTLHTECAAADYYPDRRVHFAFYNYDSPSEFEQYAQCLLAEANRDGGRKRLASASSFPKIGACETARITWLNADDRPHLSLDNDVSLMSWDPQRGVRYSRVGDRVTLCVVATEPDCPGYDLRGIDYRIHNLRTRQTWTMGDSMHVCRGA